MRELEGREKISVIEESDKDRLEHLFNMHKNSTWANFLNTAISHLLVRNDKEYGSHEQIIVKKDFAEDWMGSESPGSMSRAIVDKKKEWFKRVGYFTGI